MHSIEVDFDVYKQLTIRRKTEEVTYNDVIRELLGIEASNGTALKASIVESRDDWIVKNVRFPVGTEFRATYKGRSHIGVVRSGELVVDGKSFSSPSAAAISITENSVNGWKFWECKLPGKSSWRLIESMRK